MTHMAAFRIMTRATSLSNEDADPNGRELKEGNLVRGESGVIRIGQSIASGGEGTIYSTDRNGKVAKIYLPKCRTTFRQAKVRKMAEAHLSCPGICFPEEVLYDLRGRFVGFLMDQAEGKTLAVTVMQPMRMKILFPEWDEKDSASLCRVILEKVQYLHSMGIIMGDVNPGNILMKDSDTVCFVDTDSYQIEDFPCPVGKPDYTAPEMFHHGTVDYPRGLRTMDQDNYSVSVLLFQILIRGKSPYTAVGSGMSEHGTRIFPYREDGTDSGAIPPGKWNSYWCSLSKNIRKAFCSTFVAGEKHSAPGRRYSALEWLSLVDSFQEELTGSDSQKSGKKAQRARKRLGGRTNAHRTGTAWTVTVCLLKAGFNISLGIALAAHVSYFLHLAGYISPLF